MKMETSKTQPTFPRRKRAIVTGGEVSWGKVENTFLEQWEKMGLNTEVRVNL